MKKLILFSLIAILALSLSSCAKREEFLSYAKEVFEKPHDLRKMKEMPYGEGESSGSFFLASGSINSSSSTGLSITFSWLHPKGTYFNTTLPYDKFETNLVSSCEVPQVSFVWEQPCSCVGGEWDIKNLNDLVEVNHMIKYAVIICKPEQWPVSIQLPYEKDPIQN